MKKKCYSVIFLTNGTKNVIPMVPCKWDCKRLA